MEEIVPIKVEQRNHFSNKFNDFQVLIEELKNRSLMAKQRFEQLEAQRVEQAKVWVKHARVVTPLPPPGRREGHDMGLRLFNMIFRHWWANFIYKIKLVICPP